MRKPVTRDFGVLTTLSFTIFMICQSAQADVAGMFSKGRTHLSIYGGTGYAFNDSYFVFGASGSYFFANGFNVGLAAEHWSGGNPGISKISPSLQYVFYQPAVVKPYVGIFYRRTYIENLPDLESQGARAGVYFATGKNIFVGVGGVYESYLSCTETVYNSCDDTYSEISLTFAF